jgi:hypothetical protein
MHTCKTRGAPRVFASRLFSIACLAGRQRALAQEQALTREALWSRILSLSGRCSECPRIAIFGPPPPNHPIHLSNTTSASPSADAAAASAHGSVNSSVLSSGRAPAAPPPLAAAAAVQLLAAPQPSCPLPTYIQGARGGRGRRGLKGEGAGRVLPVHCRLHALPNELVLVGRLCQVSSPLPFRRCHIFCPIAFRLASLSLSLANSSQRF